MKTKYIKKALPLAALCLATIMSTSCDDYLEATPTETQTTQTFYKSEAQMDQALTGLYGAMMPLPKYLLTMSEFRSDNVWITTDTKQNDYVDIATFNGDALLTDDVISDCWNDYFKVVAAANTFLDKIENVEFEDEKVKAQYTAEARAIRALAYFDLVRFFGRVPAPTHTLTTNESFELKQSEPKDVYEKIIVPDLRYAVDNLAETSTDYQGKAHQERLTNIAAKGFLGKVYMTMAGFPLNMTEKKDLATMLFKDVIDYADAYGKYWASTQDEWNRMWIHENDNKFFIFELQYEMIQDYGNPMVTLSLASNPGSEWCATKLITGTHVYVEKSLQNHFIIQDSTKSDLPFVDGRAWGTVNTRQTVDEEGNLSTLTGNIFYTKFFENRIKRAALGYSDMDASIIDRTYWPQNYPLLRLEDVMLLYAECVGNTDEGRRQVNRIRERAGLSDITASLSEDEFQKAVQDERRYELAEEGQRWFDLVRRNEWQQALKTMFVNDDQTADGTYKAYAQRVDEYSYVYPIPLSQIEVRDGLYTQNPGY